MEDHYNLDLNHFSATPYQIKRRNQAIEWARNILQNKVNYVILDTETTGLKDTDVIVHLAIMNLDREMLINTFIKPLSTSRISKTISDINGITMRKLRDAPEFEPVWMTMVEMVQGKTILIYNAKFHSDMLINTIVNEGVQHRKVKLQIKDVREEYTAFRCSFSDLGLPGRDNTGEGDCNATLDVIEKIASGEIIDVNELSPKASTAALQKNSNMAKSGVLMIMAGVILLLFYPGYGIALVFAGLFFFIIGK